ncbi:MAG: hypothetical protein WCO04_13475 [Pseudomonadota bacterium]
MRPARRARALKRVRRFMASPRRRGACWCGCAKPEAVRSDVLSGFGFYSTQGSGQLSEHLP